MSLGKKPLGKGIKYVESQPPSGKKRIRGLYWDPDTDEVVLDVES